MGSSTEMVVAPTAIVSLLIGTMLGAKVSANENPTLYLHQAFTTTLFAGIFQASLGALRLGFLVDFISNAAIVGFMAGVATVVCLQQLKGILGLQHFTHETNIVSVMRSISSQTHMRRWQSALMGCCFLSYLIVARYISRKRANLFWISAMAPLTSPIMGSLVVFLTRAENHGVQVIEQLSPGLNPLPMTHMVFVSPNFLTAVKTGIVTGIVCLTRGIVVCKSFAMSKNYHIDANKEMIAFGMMNILGSLTSCYPTLGSLSQSVANVNAGGKTAASNIVTALAILFTLVFLTPRFQYTPVAVLSSIIMATIMGIVDYEAAIHMWRIDKLDFVVFVVAYIGLVFGSIEIGLVFVRLAISIQVESTCLKSSRRILL